MMSETRPSDESIKNACNNYYQYVHDYKQLHAAVKNLVENRELANDERSDDDIEQQDYEYMESAIEADMTRLDALADVIAQHVAIIKHDNYNMRRFLTEQMFVMILDGYVELFNILYEQLDEPEIVEYESWVINAIKTKEPVMVKSLLGKIGNRKLLPLIIVDAVKTEDEDIVRDVFDYIDHNLTQASFVACIEFVGTSLNDNFAGWVLPYLISTSNQLHFEPLMRKAIKYPGMYDLLNSEYHSFSVKYYNIFLKALQCDNVEVAKKIYERYLRNKLKWSNEATRRDIYAALFEGNAGDCAKYLLKKHFIVSSVPFVIKCLNYGKLKLVKQILYARKSDGADHSVKLDDGNSITFNKYLEMLSVAMYENLVVNITDDAGTYERILIIVAYLQASGFDLNGRVDRLFVKAIERNYVEIVKILVGQKITMSNDARFTLNVVGSDEMKALLANL